MSKSQKTGKTYSVDRMMLNVAFSLIRDFQTNSNDPTFCSDYLSLLKEGNLSRIREFVPAPTDEMDIASFKATYQVQSLFKRYRFSKDTYSDDELVQKAIDGFCSTQDRLESVHLDSLPASSQVVLELASRYIAKVLGVYSDEEHRDLCRFGRRASVGIPARSACEAARWELPISGSQEQIDWFDSEMSQIACVQEYWAKQKESDPHRSTYQSTTSLKLSLVPKTFKSLRSIMPNTTIGSYLSFGLGEMIRKRLKRNGYDIRSLQMRHRVLASRASLTGIAVTADLSAASDSITVALVRRLFPADWFEILNRTRIKKVTLPNGQTVESKTFCTMGIGYTFPLQTLVFLALLKAIEASLYDRLDRRTISVYGDDLIYDRRMHPQVVHYFQQFGFVINLDKTYHEGHFRESCGGDYYHGVDVRPFQPRNGSAMVGRHAYEAVLYKFINGLLMRWSEYEIEKTLLFLVSELEAVTGSCKLVPISYPDDSGIKVSSPVPQGFLRYAKCAKPKSLGHGVFRFSYLRLTSDLQKENRHEPYYWAALRGGIPSAYSRADGTALQELPGPLCQFIELTADVKEVEPLLITREDAPIRTFRSKLSGRRLRRTSTYVTISHTGRYKRQSGISCFEARR